MTHLTSKHARAGRAGGVVRSIREDHWKVLGYIGLQGAEAAEPD